MKYLRKLSSTQEICCTVDMQNAKYIPEFNITRSVFLFLLKEVILSCLNRLGTNSSERNRLLYYLLDNLQGVCYHCLNAPAILIFLNLVFSKGSGSIITEANEIPITSSTIDRAISENTDCQWT